MAFVFWSDHPFCDHLHLERGRVSDHCKRCSSSKDRNPKISNTRKNMRKAFIVFILALMFGIGWAFGILGSEDRNVLSIVFQFLFI